MEPELVPISPVIFDTPIFNIVPIEVKIAKPVTDPNIEEQPIGIIIVDDIDVIAPILANNLPSKTELLLNVMDPLLEMNVPFILDDAPIDVVVAATQ